MTLDSPRGSGASGRFTAPTAPYAHGSVVRAGDDPPRIAREGEPARDVGVPREASDGIALSQVEEQTGPRAVDARERAAVRRELGVRRALGVPAQRAAPPPSRTGVCSCPSPGCSSTSARSRHDSEVVGVRAVVEALYSA